MLNLRFLGRPDFQSRGPQNPNFEGLWSDLGQKSGAPQTQIQRPQIQRPILGPLMITVQRLRIATADCRGSRDHSALRSLPEIIGGFLKATCAMIWSGSQWSNNSTPPPHHAVRYQSGILSHSILQVSQCIALYPPPKSPVSTFEGGRSALAASHSSADNQ